MKTINETTHTSGPLCIISLADLESLCESFKCLNENFDLNFDLHDGYTAARAAIAKATEKSTVL